MEGTCEFDGRPVFARIWCVKHYQRWLKHGSPLWEPPHRTTAERFWQKVDKNGPNGCWVWTAATVRGYGYFRLGDKQLKAYRWAYEDAKGPIPEGLTIDHLCRNKACVNPDHLEAVTFRENTLRGDTITARNAAKTHCPEGHPYDAVLPWTGERSCTTCRRKRDREYKMARRRAAGIMGRPKHYRKRPPI